MEGVALVVIDLGVIERDRDLLSWTGEDES